MLQNATFLLLAAVDMATIGIAIGIALCIVGVIISILGLLKVTSARKEAEKIKADAINECKTLKKEAIVEAKEQEHKLRSEFEKESREKRAELLKMEQRLNQKDEILNKKDASLLKRNEEVESLAKSLEAKHQERMQLYDWMAQAIRDAEAGGKGNLPAVFHKKNHAEILVTMRLEDWFNLYREWEAGFDLKG